VTRVPVENTSASLLERLRVAGPEAADWRHLHDLYRPLIHSWLGQAGLTAEADDLAQEVLIVVVRELPAFRRQRDGSFRSWLRRVTVNRVRTWRQARHRRPITGIDPADRFLSQLEDPGSELSARWDREHDRHVFDKLLAVVRVGCEPVTWEAFRLFAIEGHSAAEAAARTGLTENAVMLAKSRLLRRLRQEASGLID
jgi:RNA polymerase sigma-70 factor, ECF subfamily